MTDMRTTWLGRSRQPSGSAEYLVETEIQQTSIRFMLGGVAAAYIWLVAGIGAMEQPVLRLIVLDMAQFFAFAALIFCWARVRPGINHGRRALSMAVDYGSTAVLIGAAGATMTPVFVVLLWITVGYGIRYGRAYLLTGTVLALASLLCIGIFSPYWGEQPYFLVTNALMVLLVPGYAHSLTSALRRAHNEAQRADLAKSRFLAQASHDLRQPIHAISLFTTCLKDSGLNPDQSDMVASIDRALTGVSGLFKSLLDVSTLDSGRIVPRPQHFPIGPLLRDIAAQHGEAAKRARVRLTIVDTSLCVQTDRTILSAIIGNLVSNAVKYAPGRAAVIGCRRRGGQISILICDNGPGIAEADQARVFDEFYRSPRHRHTREGIGLGLPIVSRMARLLGLRVVLRSVPGRGTGVEIMGLDLSPEAVPVAVAVAGEQPLPLTALSGMRVLLIEDHDEVRAATRRMLEGWGCVIEDDASAHAAARDCDLILADQDLEDGTGGEVIERIRAALGRQVPAIIMSGHDAAHIAEQLQDKSLPILSKPVHPARLRAAMMAQKFAVQP